jgi:adenylosuccinate synthase
MKELGITEVPEPYATALDTSVPDLVHNLQELITYLRPLKPLVSAVDGAVFEGAQGLALDEFLGEFPHVTRSITGLPYAILDAANLGVTKLQPVYCTRAYLTRHGAGPLEFEGRDFNGFQVKDETNVQNAWQGELRFAPLNLPMLHTLIHADLHRAQFVSQAHGVELLRPRLAMTCLDQLHGDVTIIDLNGEFKTLRTSYLPIYVAERLHLELSHISHGPDSRDVQFLGRA